MSTDPTRSGSPHYHFLMEYQIAFALSPGFTSRIARQSWLRNYLKGYLWWMAVPLFTLVMSLGSGDISFGGRGGWMLGMLLGIVLTFAFLLVYSYRKNQQAIALAARKWGGMEVKYTFDDRGISAQSDLSSSWRSWQMVHKAQITPDALLLFSGEQTYIALPSDQVTDDLRQFIASKVRAAGGKVGR